MTAIELDAMLARVDAELAAWDASPHSWSPGDPLHERPECTDDCADMLDACTAACVELPACGHECDHQYVRPLMEVFEQAEEIQNSAISTRWLSWCKTCDVGWASDDSPCCWVCGAGQFARFQLDRGQRGVLAHYAPTTIAAAAAAEEEQARRRVLER